MAYEVRWEPPIGVVLVLSEVVRNLDFEQAVCAVHNNYQYDRLKYVIDDLSSVTSFEVDAETIEDVFASSIGAGLSNPNRRIYVISNNATVINHLERMMRMYPGELPIELHASIESARAAIDRHLAKSERTIWSPKGRNLVS